MLLKSPTTTEHTKPSGDVPQLFIREKYASFGSDIVMRFSRTFSRMDGLAVCVIYLLSQTSGSGALARDPWLGCYASILRLVDELGQIARNAEPNDKAAVRVSTYVGLIWGRINSAIGNPEDMATAQAMLELSPTTMTEVASAAAAKVAEAQFVQTKLRTPPKNSCAHRRRKMATTLSALATAKRKAAEEGLHLSVVKITEAQDVAAREKADRVTNTVTSQQ